MPLCLLSSYKIPFVFPVYQKPKKISNLRNLPGNKNESGRYLEFIADDELVEVTPKSIRIRKLILDENARRRAESVKNKIA